MWVLSRWPSLPLLRLLTDPEPGHAALLSVGVACSTLLADPRQPELALQLLDGFVSRGRGKHKLSADTKPLFVFFPPGRGEVEFTLIRQTEKCSDEDVL